MNVKNILINSLGKRIVILDGATGTELQSRGMPAGACPEQWCVKNPLVLQGIHADYVKAGADIIYTSTFGANRFKLAQYKIHTVRGINRELALIARKAAGKKALVAGDIGPTGHFVSPFGSTPLEEAVDAYKEQVKGLLEGKVDIFVIETMMDIQEARAALIAVKETTSAFVMVTMTFEKNGRTLNGTDPISALITLQSLGADAVGCNCSAGPEDMLAVIQAMKPYATVPLVAKPNAGMPRLSGNKTVFNMEPKRFASFSGKFVSCGVNMLGGCCGTSPEHIYELKQAVRGKKPLLRQRSSISALSSASKTVFIGRNKPVLMIGERINPTGKKELQEALLHSKFSLVRQMAKEQENEGAHLLDINLGAAGVHEEKTMKAVMGIVPAFTGLPLVIDSSDPRAIEAALRLYPGRALINSIPGEKKKLKRLFPLAAKYGAMCILLPVTDSSIPETFQERKAVILELYRKAKKYSFTKDDLVIDALTMSVSSHQKAALETLKTIEWCSRQFKCNSCIGLSNVSFGLPKRKWINTAFLAMARGKGLTMAILNTAGLDAKNTLMASDVLTGKDKSAKAYIAFCTQSAQSVEPGVLKKERNIRELISQAIVEGNRDDIVVLMQRALKSGEAPEPLVNQVLIPAITKVGDLFDKKEYFLPQLIASAETTKDAFDFLRPSLEKGTSGSKQKAVVILSTVKGDIHDIGKNIVSLMLSNHGFSVIDLGKDVSAERFVNAARRH